MDNDNDTEPIVESSPHEAQEGLRDSNEPSRLWTRRRLITLAISVLAGAVTVRYWPFGSSEESPKISDGKRHDKPRFKRRKTPALSASGSLSVGFYFQPVFDRRKKSNKANNTGSASHRPLRRIVHYVDTQHRALFVSEFDQSRAQQAKPEELSLRVKDLRVHLGRASAIFEIAALEQVGQKNYLEACGLLITGIKHDLAFKQKIRGVPSLRLFDLLAKISARRKDEANLNELLSLAKSASDLAGNVVIGEPASRIKKGGKQKRHELQRKGKLPKDMFAARIAKWSDLNSEWRKKMVNPSDKVFWKLSIAPDTTNGKSVKKEFEIESAS